MTAAHRPARACLPGPARARGVAGSRARHGPGALRAAGQEERRGPVGQLRRAGRVVPVLRLDRRPLQPARRRGSTCSGSPRAGPAASGRRRTSAPWRRCSRRAGCGRPGSPRSRPPGPTGAGSAPTPAPTDITVPDDLAAALDAEPAARAAFETARRREPLRRPLAGAHRCVRGHAGASGSPPWCRCCARGAASTEPRRHGAARRVSRRCGCRAEAGLVDARHRDRLTEGAGVHHHPVADVHAHVADRASRRTPGRRAAARRATPRAPAVDCARLECGSATPAAA